MNSSSAHLQYRDFEPVEKQKDVVKTMLDHLQNSAPADASIKGTIQQKQTHFEGRIRIISRSRIFIAKAEARNLFTLVAKLHAKLIKQIVTWRKIRFGKRGRSRQSFRLVSASADHFEGEN